jgi:HlyD family secretion protein
VKRNPLLNSSGTRMVATVSAIAVAVAAYGGYTAWVVTSGNKSQPTESQSPEAEKKKEAAAAIGALGRLEPAGEVHKIASPSGGFSSRVEKMLVKEGDTVKPGQPIAVMDSYSSLLGSAKQAEAQMIEANMKLEGVKAGAKIGDINAQKATIGVQQAGGMQAQAEVRRSAVDLENAQLEFTKARSAAVKLEAEVNKAQWDFKAYDELYKKGAIAEAEKRNKELVFVSKQQEFAQAKQTIAQAAKNVSQRQSSLEGAQSVVLQSQAKVAAEGQRLSSVSEVRPTDVKQAEAQVLVAQANFEKAKSDLERSIVKSPIPGKVLKIHAKETESVGTDGIMELGFTDKMFVVAEVDENSISKIKKGDRATIKSDAFQGEISGKVEIIGSQVRKNAVTSADPSDKQDVRVVEVKILLDDSNLVKGLTNLQVKVSIQP